MSNLQGYRCPNCDAMIPISRNGIYKCECCGSEYEKADSYGIRPLQVEVCNAELVTLAAKGVIHEEYLVDPDMKEKIVEMTVEGIAKEIAGSLVPLMEIETCRDPFEMKTIIAGKVRVARPDSRMTRW